MGDVSQSDEHDRPEEPGRDVAPGSGDGPQDPDFSDTQPLGATGSSYPPPSGSPEQPGPYGQPYGQQPGQPQPTSAYPTQPVQSPYGYAPGYPQQPQAQRSGGGTTRFPGWAWPVVTIVALLVGLLGGVIGGVAVSTSMSPNGVQNVPVIGAEDNGAPAPLDAGNGSIAAVAAKLLPSTVQIQARGGAGGTTQGGATGSGFVLDDKHHVITNNHVVADATGDGELKVVDQNGKKHDAKIIGRSPVYD